MVSRPPSFERIRYTAIETLPPGPTYRYFQAEFDNTDASDIPKFLSAPDDRPRTAYGAPVVLTEASALAQVDDSPEEKPLEFFSDGSDLAYLTISLGSGADFPKVGALDIPVTIDFMPKVLVGEETTLGKVKAFMDLMRLNEVGEGDGAREVWLDVTAATQNINIGAVNRRRFFIGLDQSALCMKSTVDNESGRSVVGMSYCDLADPMSRVKGFVRSDIADRFKSSR